MSLRNTRNKKSSKQNKNRRLGTRSTRNRNSRTTKKANTIVINLATFYFFLLGLFTLIPSVFIVLYNTILESIFDMSTSTFGINKIPFVGSAIRDVAGIGFDTLLLACVMGIIGVGMFVTFFLTLTRSQKAHNFGLIFLGLHCLFTIIQIALSGSSFFMLILLVIDILLFASYLLDKGVKAGFTA